MYLKVIFISIVISIQSCDDNKATELSSECIEQCNKVPQVGPCNAAVPIYYYNKNEM